MSEHISNNTKLVLLVGGNPLPNFLSACALRPSVLVLVYTQETEDAKARLRCELERALGRTVAFDDPVFIADATCATTVRRALDPVFKDPTRTALLNYTGGTKVMAAHARLAFFEAGGQPNAASYLDDPGARLRFDDGTSTPLADYQHNIQLTLATVLALHGITHKPRQALEPAPTPADARAILCRVLADPSVAGRLYAERKRLEGYGNPQKTIGQPFTGQDYGLTLSVPVFPTQPQLAQLPNRKQRESWFEQWYRFIAGEWLEVWLGSQIDTLRLQPNPEVTIGVNAYRGENRAQLEVDIAVVRGHRSYFVSCTTDAGKAICKSKLFEVAVRSRQLGGDLARGALVCLADDVTVSALQKDVDDVWGTRNTTRVFGLSDVRTWADCDGRHPNRHSLKTWLES